MRLHRLRLVAAAVLTSLVAGTAAVTVTAPPAYAAECDFNEPGDLCYELVQTVLDLVDRLGPIVDDLGDRVRECVQGSGGSPCDNARELVGELIGQGVGAVTECLDDPESICNRGDELAGEVLVLAGQVLGIVLQTVEDGEAFVYGAIDTILLIVNDQITQLLGIADEVAGPYLDLLEGVVTELIALVLRAAPTEYAYATSTHNGPTWQLRVARACTGTTDRPAIGLTTTTQTVRVAGAATATTVPTSGSTLTRFTKLECLVQRPAPTGPVTLASFERTLADPFTAVTGTAVIPAGEFVMCARGEVTLTDGTVVPFGAC